MKLNRYNPLHGLSLPVAIPTREWATENIYLAPRVAGGRPGQWRRDNISAICASGGPLDALDSLKYETVVVCKGSQTGFTTAAYVWLARAMVQDPGSALIVMNGEVDAREKSSEAWRPLWEESPRLKKWVPENRRSDWTKLYQLITQRPVYWIGANSAGRLASKPIRRLLLDEVDKYPDKFGTEKDRKEAGAVALAEQRTKTFKESGLAKIVIISTPTTQHGEVYTRYIQGDQRKFWVPCPQCQTMQVMVWSQFRIDMELAVKNAQLAVDGCQYECPHCKARWSDQNRYDAIDKGEWRASEAPKDPTCASFHFPSWLSKWVTHRYLANRWIKAQESKSQLQDFVNSECGEPFVQYESVVTFSSFIQREGEYQEGEHWPQVGIYKELYKETDSYVCAGVDVQKGYLVAVFREFVIGGDSGLIWAGDIATLDALDELADKFKAQYILIDSRYRTHEINVWCATHTGYLPCQGVVRRGRSLFTADQLNVEEGKRGQVHGASITMLRHDPDMLKSILHELVTGKNKSMRWMLPKGYSTRRDYCQQMTAEKEINGHWQTMPAGRPNHFWDAEALALLAAIYTGLTKQTGETNADDTTRD